MFPKSFVQFSLVLVIYTSSQTHCKVKEEDIVQSWAATLGNELWELGMTVTKAHDIRTSYKRLNARVLPTDGEGILKSIVTNVNRLLKRKLDAVMCIIDAAEDQAESFKYDPSYNYSYHNVKLLQTDIEPCNFSNPLEDEICYDMRLYKEMDLKPDNHFYGIAINESHSGVHVPIDVYDQSDVVQAALQWSENLDQVFIQNYESDPTMSWQYFGSSTGFMRHYPALEWKYQGPVDLFDCRTRFWFIEAATCTKDMVILIDNSGSMTGMRNTIARLTVKTILDTMSSNDFVNIFSFNKTTEPVMPCIPSDTLVQATRENIEAFKSAIDELEPDDRANFPKAFTTAFDLLKRYRENKTCPDDTCNQAVMLVTDSVPDNLTEVFEEHNWFDNHTRIPVRVFTYLIGKEVTNVREIQYMACLNRGYYVHIQALEEVRSQVLKYIGVMARPLVLQAEEHPLSWTHTFVDATGDYDVQTSSEKYRLMTSISGPAYDRVTNRNNNTKAAELLGIAGTDVLIRDIKRLTLPYKIGVNGYAFMLTNNGYLMIHPDLRHELKGELKVNFNSIDLSEVELYDDDVYEPRQPDEKILELREAMVNHEEGIRADYKMKFHYDNMKRVGAETRTYYFAPLNNTPFSMGLALPHPYGSYWIEAVDEISKSLLQGISLENYFKGNWRVHPEWSYCDYHRTDKVFATAEAKLVHFMKKINSPGWVWREQFSAEDDTTENTCNRRKIKKDEYFCDKELMQLLVFDARSTEHSYKNEKYVAKSRIEQELAVRYGATLRFVATQSGLTRWQDIPVPLEDDVPFGDTNNRALDENWYKSAVLHHHIDPDAFVFSVPFDAGALDNISVTVAHAIFPRDGGQEAPASVVGLQMLHSNLYTRFMQITSAKSICRDCLESCDSDEFDCYLIDGNGYIVLSEVRNDTGRFFGEIEGAVMESMVSKNIFRQVPMFDYQALCFTETYVSSSVDFLWTPFHHIGSLLKGFLGRLLWLFFQTSLWIPAGADSQDYDYGVFEVEKEPAVDTKAPSSFSEPTERKVVTSKACDQMGTLYLLQNLNKEGYHSTTSANCSRPFYVKRVPKTNLLLIVVNALHQSCYRKLHSNMEEIEYNTSDYTPLSCQKLYMNSYPRRHLSGCYNTHPLEKEIEMCGRSSTAQTNTFLLTSSFLFFISYFKFVL